MQERHQVGVFFGVKTVQNHAANSKDRTPARGARSQRALDEAAVFGDKLRCEG
jgi:hypothetical protein